MYALVPRKLDEQTTEVFVGQFYSNVAPAGGLRIVSTPEVGGASTQVLVSAGEWHHISGGNGPSIYFAVVQLPTDKRGVACRLSLVDVHGIELAEGSIEDRPYCVPIGDEGQGANRPFTIWASSCFYAPNADDGLGAMIDRLMASKYRPHCKVLLGDQVYLDAPIPWRFAMRSQASLREHFNSVYTKTWTHPAFSKLLANGRNIFLPDDHEVWNNYPSRPLDVMSWIRGNSWWKSWETLALDERLHPIQAPSPTTQLDINGPKGVPALSMFVADMRTNRAIRATEAMSSYDMNTLVTWIQTLSVPGVLFLSQPLFVKRGGETDGGLARYKQIREVLIPALREAKADIVMVVGDVHIGRVASTPTKSGRRLIEIVTSPLALVSEPVANTGILSSSHFPGFGRTEERSEITLEASVPSYRLTGGRNRTEEHGMTLSFHIPRRTANDAQHGRVTITARAWFARTNTKAPPWSWSTELRSAPAP